MNSRIQNLHDLDYSPGLLVSLFTILDGLEISHHLLDITSVFRDIKPYPLRIVKQLASIYLFILHNHPV